MDCRNNNSASSRLKYIVEKHPVHHSKGHQNNFGSMEMVQCFEHSDPQISINTCELRDSALPSFIAIEGRD